MNGKIFELSDLDSGSKAIVIVRDVDVGIGLTISLEENGDVEVIIPKELAGLIGQLLMDLAKGTRLPPS